MFYPRYKKTVKTVSQAELVTDHFVVIITRTRKLSVLHFKEIIL